MKIKVEKVWHCRRNGGLFLGFRVDFPITLWESKGLDKDTTWKRFGVALGFLVFSIRIIVDYDFKEERY